MPVPKKARRAYITRGEYGNLVTKHKFAILDALDSGQEVLASVVTKHRPDRDFEDQVVLRTGMLWSEISKLAQDRDATITRKES